MYPFIHILNFTIPTYGLCMAIGIFLCGFLIIKKAVKSGFPFEDMLIFEAISLGAAIIGAAALYIFVTYSPKELCAMITSGDFSFLTNGGLVFYGGLLFGTAGALLSARLLKMDIGNLESCVVPYLPLGHAIGRIGCLMAGCCHGFLYRGIFAVWSAAGGSLTYFPLQAVEAAANLLIMFVLLRYSKTPKRKLDILSAYFLMYSISRFGLEFLRGDEIRGSFLAFSTSQWISLGICTGVILFRLLRRRKNNIAKAK